MVAPSRGWIYGSPLSSDPQVGTFPPCFFFCPPRPLICYRTRHPLDRPLVLPAIFLKRFTPLERFKKAFLHPARRVGSRHRPEPRPSSLLSFFPLPLSPILPFLGRRTVLCSFHLSTTCAFSCETIVPKLFEADISVPSRFSEPFDHRSPLVHGCTCRRQL